MLKHPRHQRKFKTFDTRTWCTCIDDENLPYRGVRGKALVKISTDVEDNIQIAERIMIKYTGDLKNKVAKMLMSGVEAGKSAILEITPIYYSTWDHSES